jgi:hypothetical protein
VAKLALPRAELVVYTMQHKQYSCIASSPLVVLINTLPLCVFNNHFAAALATTTSTYRSLGLERCAAQERRQQR